MWMLISLVLWAHGSVQATALQEFGTERECFEAKAAMEKGQNPGMDLRPLTYFECKVRPW